jgi:hypothetical protein
LAEETPPNLIMPTPFMCNGCDTPTMNINGVCDACSKKKPIFKQDIVGTLTAMLDNWEKEHFTNKREGNKKND